MRAYSRDTLSRVSRKTVGATLIFVAAPFAASAAPAQPVSAKMQSMPQQQQIINLNLMQALVTVGADKLAGVFGFIPEQNTPPAFADYLLRNYSAMKKFVKKGEKDLKDVGAVNEWDQQAFLYLIQLNNMSVQLGAKPISESWMNRISALSLAPAVPLAEITNRRKSRGL